MRRRACHSVPLPHVAAREPEDSAREIAVRFLALAKRTRRDDHAHAHNEQAPYKPEALVWEVSLWRLGIKLRVGLAAFQLSYSPRLAT